MDSQLQHLQPNQLYTTTEAAAMLGVATATLRSHKSRHKETLIEGTHWQRQSSGTAWTTAGVLTIAERTSTPQAKSLLAQIVKASQHQSAPLTLVVDNTAKTNNLEAVEAHLTDGLSADEEQVFVETMEGKLPEPQVQSLLQQMQDLDTTPTRSQGETETPPFLQYCSVKNRLLVAASLVATLILGGSGGWFISRMNVTSAAVPSDASDRKVALHSTVAERNSTIAHSLTLATQQQDAIDIMRRDYLLTQAERERKKTGTSIEQWLIRHLNKQTEALQRNARDNSGSAQHIAIARSITGETKATLLALQSRRTLTKSYLSTVTELKRSLQQKRP